MIFFFSATGNSEYVAKRIARATGDGATPVEVVPMAERLNDGALSFDLAPGEPIGFVTPTYFWGLPTVVADFLDRVALNAPGPRYAYHVLTYGTTTGQAHRMLERRVKRLGLAIDGKFNVRMVDTWTPLFNLSDPASNAAITKAAEPAIDAAIARIVARAAGDFDDAKVPEPFPAMFYLAYRTGRKTKKFSVTDACVGCGTCESVCPTRAIAMKGGKPEWVKDRCALCLSCLHHCPSFAIRRGAASARHGQFVNPNA